jgi:hypothetical protein
VQAGAGIRPGVVNAGVVQPAPQPGVQAGAGIRPGVVNAGVVQPAPQPGVQAGAGIRPGVVNAGVAQPAPQPGVRPGMGVGVGVGAGIRPGNANPGVAVASLTCSVSGGIMPRGAQLIVQGSGFGPDVRVEIGGQFAPVLRSTATQATVQIPNDSSGGLVSVASQGRSAQCGAIRTTGAGGR